MADLDALIAQARGGSREAFTEIVFLHQASLRTYLDRFLSTKDPDIVDDLAQQTFLDAYRGLGAYEGDTPFNYWLLRLAKHRALTYLRGEERRRMREKAAVESLLSEFMARRLEREADEPSRHERRLAALRECLETLRGRSAEIVADFYFRKRSGVEIARRGGTKEGAVWAALLRVRQALRRCMQSRLSLGGAGP